MINNSFTNKITLQIQNSLQYTPEDIVVKVYSLARTVADTLRCNGLLFWTSGGTTLGQNQVRCW